MRTVLLTLLFVGFLYPLSLDGVSVNYSFLLLPVLHLCIGGRIRKPDRILISIIACYAAVFVMASFYQYDFHADAVRRVTSFVLFMSMFSYVFMNIDEQMVQAFKGALVAIGLIMTLFSVYLFITLGGSALGFEAKDLVGSQRFGFIYLLAIWLVYTQVSRSILIRLAQYALLATLLTGLALTFSRSSIVALLASFGVFALTAIFKWARRPTTMALRKAAGAVAGVAFLAVLLHAFVPLAFSFFEERLFSFALDSTAVAGDLGEDGSTGTRLLIASRVVDFVLHNPLTGAGYLGIWILDFAGSAHNQYVDVLFRTGIFGFVAYIYLLVCVAAFLFRNERRLFWGFTGVLAYGLFHETFKESQGGFVLAFLLGMMAHSWRTARTCARSRSSDLPSVSPSVAIEGGGIRR